MLKHNADVNAQNSKNETGLHLSIISDNNQVATALLKNPLVNSDLQNKGGNTAAHLMTMKSESVDMLEIFLSTGRSPDVKSRVFVTRYL
jgi:ankyrin repeat protein